MIATAVLLVIALMVLAGDTPAGRAMRRTLVERPAARLARLDRADVAASLLLLMALGLVLTTCDADPLVQALALVVGPATAALRRRLARRRAVRMVRPALRARSPRTRIVHAANDEEGGVAAHAA